MSFIHLHAHTTFSFLDGYGTPDQIANRIAELGHNACAITDHGNIFGHVPCYQTYSKLGVKPILGCEFYICDNMNVKNRDDASASLGYACLPHITILARTQQGYSNLLKLARMSYEYGFYHKPRIDHETLFRFQEGLTVLSGCPTGYPTRILLQFGYLKMVEWLSFMNKNIESYFVEIVPQPGWNVSQTAAPALMRAAIELRIPPVITADAHFPRESDHLSQDALLAVGLRTTIYDETREIKLPSYQYYCSESEILERCRSVLPEFGDDVINVAIQNSQLIADSTVVELKKAKSVAFPKKPPNMSSSDLLWSDISIGFNTKRAKGLIPDDKVQDYIDRAIKEFKVLKDKGFVDYILAIADVIKWMKKQDGLVMTRGSAGGCLLLWLLSASETDPIVHDLSFERFYDSTRSDPPDVDIDFEQLKRDSIIDYMYSTYGEKNCSQIAALSRLSPRGAVQSACSALDIHRSQFHVLSDVMNDKDMDVERQLNSLSDVHAIELLNKHPKLREIIIGMTGQYRHSSVHAAGILVSSMPLEDVIGVMVNDHKTIAMVDKYGAAELGFMKMDMLSVSALDITAKAARMARGNVDWLYTLPLNDANVFNTAKNKLLAGVFQLDGDAAKKTLESIGADSFEDLVAASVLCRPGAIEYVSVYKRNKQNRQEFERYLSSIHPTVAEIVKGTYGVIMYQEQVMKIARELVGLDWVLVHKLRKDVGNKIGLDPQKGDAWRAEWYERFVNGAISHSNISRQEAEQWWEVVQHHGGYSFNRSHALTYGVVGYWMLYLKTYYPALFYQAYLEFEQDNIIKKRLIMEFKKGGGNVLILDHKHSKESFSSINENTLVGGYSDLKYVGPAMSKKILDKIPFDSVNDMILALPKRTKELLEEANIFGNGIVNPSSLIKVAPWAPLPGINPVDQVSMSQYQLRPVNELPSGVKFDGDCRVGGYVTATNFSKDRMLFVLENDKGLCECRIPSNRIKSIGHKFKLMTEGDFVCVEGWWTGDTLFAKDCAILRRG